MPPNSAQQNIWKQMNYTPPRGSCNHKESLLSPKCPCLRFMLHPLKVTSSFSCDGCGHHASFHNMASPTDDAVIARWATESTTTSTTAPADTAPRSRKRPRRALLEAGPSTTTTAAGTTPPRRSSIAVTPDLGSTFDGLFSDDVEYAVDGGGRLHGSGSRTWGDRFSSWSFGRAEEPVKTPPKKQQQQGQGTRRKRHSMPGGGSDFGVGSSDVVDLD